jgi:hypothetical protein
MWSAATFHAWERRHDARMVSRTWPGSTGSADRKRSLARASWVSPATSGRTAAPLDIPPPACHYRCRGLGQVREALEVCVVLQA